MTFRMRPSRVLRKLRAGEPAYAFKLNLPDVRAAQIAAAHGFDCLWTGHEHIGNDYAAIEHQVLAAKAWDTDLVCRVPRGSYSDYIRPLELDATGIMVPHVMSAADARAVIRRTRFQPLGLRPIDGGNSDGLYCSIPITEYMAQANSERFIILQIEDPEPLEELDEICALEGFDVLFFGAGDFSHAIGVPGEMNHPRVVEARQRVAAAARKHGKAAGAMASPANRNEMLAMGYTFLNMGADVVGLSRYCREVAQACGLMAEGSAPAPYTARQPAPGVAPD